jgi:RHS repeat-associated protein
MQDWWAGSVKDWDFDSSSATAGLAIDYSESAGGVTTLQKTYTWGASSSGNEYVTAMTSTLNPFGASRASTSTGQTVDAYGNLTQQQITDYSGSTTGGRTYNMTYTASSGTYAPLYILNRMLTATVTPSGGSPYTLSSTSYDGYCNSNGLTATSATMNHDGTNYPTTFVYRGNPTSVSGLNGSDTVCTSYDSAGVAYYSADSSGHSVSVSTDSTTNFSLPSSIAPNGVSIMATSASYSSSWAPATMTGPNGEAGSTTYDAYGRPYQTTIPDGATTTYTYTYGAGANTQTATVDGRWQTTSLDGFGRTIQVQKGNGSTVVSTVQTTYAPCACSPLGKMSAVSQPYAPGGTVYWTTYAYDGSGRTVTVTAPDGSPTQYSYSGNSTTVTDPASHGKTSTVDAYGNTIQVAEPNPAGGTFLTNYIYTPVNQLIGVSMTRGSITETRTFVYSGSDMTSSTNPENGTVNYVYDSSHHVTTRTDALGSQTQYAYDSYGRLSAVHYFPYNLMGGEDTSQLVVYYYDSNYPGPCGSLPGTHGKGRLAAVLFGGGIADAYHDSYCYEYDYNLAGRVITQNMSVQAGPYQYNDITFSASYQWDTEGRMTSLQYPTVHAAGSFGNMDVNMPIAAMQYDANGRLDGMTMDDRDGSGPQPFASASYTPAGQLYQLSWGPYTETRTYNSLMQMTNQSVPYVMNMTYNYTATHNNGRITSAVDGMTGENTSYTYDALNRLTGASNSSWSETYGYDGFGNLTSKSGTGGSPNVAPSMSVTYNAHNQQTIQSYDANGNINPGGSLYSGNTYSVENRLTWQATSLYWPVSANLYAYDPWGKRVMSGSDSNPFGAGGEPQPMYNYSFYGITGQKLAALKCDGSNFPAYPTCWIAGQNVYFGKKLIVSGGVSVVTDRLGSVRANSLSESFAYYPYGEERTSTVDGREKFGTYFRDAIGQDYADQRYYNSGMGQFLTVDPGGIKTAHSSNPTSWNRYAYVSGDPINFFDRHGRERDCTWDDEVNTLSCDVDPCDDDGTTIGCPGAGSGTNPVEGSTGVTGGTESDPQKCPQVPAFPGGDGAKQIQKNINSAGNVFETAWTSDPEVGPATAMSALMLYLAQQFNRKGNWDYKSKYPAGSTEHNQAMDFGNFDFGAVLAGLGFTLNLTQSAAGIAQIVFCMNGGSCGTGIPFIQSPFGDQAADQAQIVAGYNYEKAVLAGCVH